MTYTDYSVSLLGLLFFFTGWRKGLFRTILGPISLLVCSFIALIHYDLTHNLIKSIMIALGGAVILSIVLRLVLMLSKSAIGKTGQEKTLLISRLLGGLLNLSWKGAMLMGVLFLITLIPFNILNLDVIKTDIKHSFSYSAVNQLVISRIPAAKKMTQVFKVFENPARMERLVTSQEYKELSSDSKVKDLMNDAEIKELVDTQNYAKLLTHPKVKAIIQDDELMSKFTKLSDSIVAENMK